MAIGHVQVNRAPVLTLWAAVVACCMGFERDEALTMGRVIAGLNAYAKGKSLGLYKPQLHTLREQRKRLAPGAVLHVDLLNRAVPMMHTAQGLRALSKDKPVEPEGVQRYLESKFADALPRVEEAMMSLARSMSLDVLRARAYELYESFRPQIPAGVRGWGAAGDLDLERIRRSARPPGRLFPATDMPRHPTFNRRALLQAIAGQWAVSALASPITNTGATSMTQSAVPTQTLKPLALPPPRAEGGLPLTAALRLRRSTREYSDRPLPTQVLSDLLWAAFGINRPSGDRTAPYWRHIMVIDLYVAMADGVWLYEPKAHALLPSMNADIRAQTGLQDFVATAPVNLVYVAHGEHMTDVAEAERRLYASVDAAFIGQNVYLYCASEGLGSVFRGAVDQAKLGRAMRLPDQQFVTFAQTVGYPRA